MWRFYAWLEKLVARHDRKCGLKTRDEAFKELVETDLELRHLKLDLEPIPETIIQFLRDLFSEDFHKSTLNRPSSSLPEQERRLQQYISIALKVGMTAEEFLDLDEVEFRELMVEWMIHNQLFITEMNSGVDQWQRTTLLHSVSDAAEAVGL